MPVVTPSPDTYDRILGLRAVRNFTDEPIPDDVLEQILQAGRWTGSSKNTQNWAMVVVRDPAVLAEVMAAGDFTRPLAGAAVTIALVRLPAGYDFDIGRLAQNVMLGAAALGVASVPITLHREDQARAALGVPDDHGCRYAIGLGYPDDDAHREARSKRSFGGRKPLDEIVSYNRFGG